MKHRAKVMLLTLAVTAVALLASATTPRRLTCSQTSCTHSIDCDIPACGDVGFCGTNHHCVPE